jgi:hypothetical protein
MDMKTDVRKAAVRLSLKQKLEVASLLKAHCCVNTKGFAEYEAGWNDKAVSDKFGLPVNDIHVRNLRRELIGGLHKVSSRGQGSSTDSRLTAIEDYLTSKNPTWKSIG